MCVLQVGILQKMQHCRNTVRLLGCYESNEEVMVVTGLCSGGDLQKLSDVSGHVRGEVAEGRGQRGGPAAVGIGHFLQCKGRAGLIRSPPAVELATTADEGMVLRWP